VTARSDRVSASDNKFKILALDGGGVRGLYTATILQRIEKAFGIKCNDFFDLIVGTSAGSILAGALAVDIPIERASDLFLMQGADIFKKRAWSFYGLFKSRYRKDNLQKALAEQFGELRMGEIRKPLMVVSSDLLNSQVYIHKSGYLSQFEAYNRDGDTKLSDAVLSSCAAPTYFDPHRFKDQFLCDGGIWANNPSILGLVEAVSKFQREMSDIFILSVGAGGKNVLYNENARNWGFLRSWGGSKLIEYLLSLSSVSSTNVSKLLLKDNYLRINSDFEYKLDNTSDLDELIRQGNKEFEESEADISRFLQSMGDELTK